MNAESSRAHPHARSAHPGADAGSPLVVARGLGIRYGAKRALAGVDLDVRAGRVTALVGPSGCGKTSFLCSLNRMTDLVPGCAVEGELRLAGRAVATQWDARALRREVGMVFQRPNPFPVSIAKNLHLPLREHGCPARELAARSTEVLRLVGLWDEVADRMDTPARSLSGGQQQRLCIARALTLGPSVLLMDEPCSALDPLAAETIEELVRGLRGRITVVIVTHNLAQARRLADDVAVFWVRDGTGCLIESGPAEQVFGDPRDPDVAAYVGGRRG